MASSLGSRSGGVSFAAFWAVLYCDVVHCRYEYAGHPPRTRGSAVTDRIKRADARVDAGFKEYLDDLVTLLAQPSVSATGEGVVACADLAADVCERYGFDETDRIKTPGSPAVVAHAYADDVTGDAGDVPTVLVYGHYDVQPVAPEDWTTPPFDPEVREGPDGRRRLYARGTGDNKGQWFAHLCAVRALRADAGLPVNVTLLLEGEEESGSPNLATVVEELAADMAPDLGFVADGAIDQTGRPHVLLGARGILYVEVTARGPNRDLHSGNYGGPVPNPAWALVDVLASTKDPKGRVTIEGFYDDVRPVTDLDRDALAAMPFDTEAVRADLGVDAFAAGPGDSYLEALLYNPTLNISGFTGGYGGEGMKTVIPSTARVKVDMRLVADQDPDDVHERFRRHVADHAPSGVEVTVERLGSMAPQRTPLDHPVADPVTEAVADAWGADPILKPTLGGSLPTADIATVFDVPVVTVPYANADENNHSPDENLALRCFENGVRTSVRVFDRLAAADWRD